MVHVELTRRTLIHAIAGSPVLTRLSMATESTRLMPDLEQVEALVACYYATVNYEPRRPFDPESWSAWLAPDYTYISPAGVPLIGKEAAVESVTKDFALFDALSTSAMVMGSKVCGLGAFSCVVSMAIRAHSLEGANLDIKSTILLAFRRSRETWKLIDEVAVIRSQPVLPWELRMKRSRFLGLPGA